MRACIIYTVLLCIPCSLLNSPCVRVCVCVAALIPTDTASDPGYFSSITLHQGEKTQAA